ncbi:hypothetical protein [Erwinia psidii]|uniref:hypothetical protein n=1 Tax=Erwinia psidii TaxID=69224 RepID=UPI000F534CAE|nr:hypothetical protein [Erwinia psidii]
MNSRTNIPYCQRAINCKRRLAGAVDAAAFSADVAVTRSGELLRTATITGRTTAVMRSVAR